jgi:hypothetical protein
MMVKTKREMALNQTIPRAFVRRKPFKVFDLAFTIRIFEGANFIPRIRASKNMLKRGPSGFGNMEKNHGPFGTVHCFVNVADIICRKRTIL